MILLLVAGNETTTNLIGNVTHALLEHPDVLRAVAADPSRVPALVEEGLRYDSPVQVVFRIDDARTPRSAACGSRRASTWACSWARPTATSAASPTPIASTSTRDLSGFPGFGFGKHFCLGASLARLEARVVLETLVPELLRSSAPSARWRGSTRS